MLLNVLATGAKKLNIAIPNFAVVGRHRPAGPRPERSRR